ncbi:transcriptional regulator [Crenobacter cavernae]|uniref:DNA-binding protein n=1 Tax=Crenobacter cavernae TaxID=2290923 RepID=A0A345Y6T2_9NEIS|nr:helix-turn-helix domain-containing protein [Crenobacter cavernae]AXK39634.1 DNA-binding protein [Crenobacter cavernae]
MESKTPIDKAIELLGGVSATARLFGVTPWAVSKWRQRVPAERCIDIEKATKGAVRCEELRPDVDWAFLRSTRRRP